MENRDYSDNQEVSIAAATIVFAAAATIFFLILYLLPHHLEMSLQPQEPRQQAMDLSNHQDHDYPQQQPDQNQPDQDQPEQEVTVEAITKCCEAIVRMYVDRISLDLTSDVVVEAMDEVEKEMFKFWEKPEPPVVKKPVVDDVSHLIPKWLTVTVTPRRVGSPAAAAASNKMAPSEVLPRLCVPKVIRDEFLKQKNTNNWLCRLMVEQSGPNKSVRNVVKAGGRIYGKGPEVTETQQVAATHALDDRGDLVVLSPNHTVTLDEAEATLNRFHDFVAKNLKKNNATTKVTTLMTSQEQSNPMTSPAIKANLTGGGFTAKRSPESSPEVFRQRIKNNDKPDETVAQAAAVAQQQQQPCYAGAAAAAAAVLEGSSSVGRRTSSRRVAINKAVNAADLYDFDISSSSPNPKSPKAESPPFVKRLSKRRGGRKKNNKAAVAAGSKFQGDVDFLDTLDEETRGQLVNSTSPVAAAAETPASSSSAAGLTTACPLCQKQFPNVIIETHASRCEG